LTLAVISEFLIFADIAEFLTFVDVAELQTFSDIEKFQREWFKAIDRFFFFNINIMV